MTKSEIKILDSILVSPVILILNQYFNMVVSEYFVLWIAFVSTKLYPLFYDCHSFKRLSLETSPMTLFSVLYGPFVSSVCFVLNLVSFLKYDLCRSSLVSSRVLSSRTSCETYPSQDCFLLRVNLFP